MQFKGVHPKQCTPLSPPGPYLSGAIEKTKFHCAYKENDPYGTPMIDLPVRYQRALFNRNNSAFGIEKANPKPDDIIITSDADEILDPRVLENLDWFNGFNHYVATGPAFYFKLNFKYQDDWMGPRICNWFTLRNTTIDQLRQDHQNAYRIEDAAWHFSFLGDAENFKLKLASYEHTENNNESVVANAEEKVEKGLDPFSQLIDMNLFKVNFLIFILIKMSFCIILKMKSYCYIRIG